MEGLEYYDEERMMNEMNDALNYGYDAGYPNVDFHHLKFEGELSNFQIADLESTFQQLDVEDYKKLENNVEISGIEYKGWSIFFDRFVKLHLIVSKKYYAL